MGTIKQQWDQIFEFVSSGPESRKTSNRKTLNKAGQNFLVISSEANKI